jgi:DNA-binding MarR family transcriptional regulator
MATKKEPARDQIDEQLEIWVREIPDLDRVTEGIIERIAILNYNIGLGMDATLEEFELDRRAFSLLGKLRRVGPPYRSSAGRLAADLRLSSGAMTNRLDRLEAAGLIRRLPDPNDRRGTIVEPTERGNELWDKTVGAAARRENGYTAVLSIAEKEQLHDLLRKMMTGIPELGYKKHLIHAPEADEA